MTIPSPSSLHFRYGRDAVPEAIYPDMEDFYRDLGASLPQGGARVCRRRLPLVQLDEVNFTHVCDPELRKSARAGRRSERGCAYLCRHDQRGDRRHSRTWSRRCICAGATFSRPSSRPAATSRWPRSCSARSTSKSYFMEYDSERAGGFEPLRFVPKDKMVVLGLVTSKSGRLESKDGSTRRRGAKLSKELGGGSLTGLPVIETKANDISACISPPT